MLGNIPEDKKCQCEITSKLCFIVTFLIFIPQIMLHKEADGVFMTWQHAKFEMLGYGGILTLALQNEK